MGLFGLFGGFGEFADWSRSVHAQLVEAGAGDGSVLILPMALDPGRVVSEDLALYRDLGIGAEIVDVTSRAGAERAERAEPVSRASLIFLHGGAPDWVCDVLRGTPVWHAIVEAVTRGASLAGTSAGIMCLGNSVPASNAEEEEPRWVAGLGVLSGVVVAAHWDNDRWETVSRSLRELPDTLVLGIDERTAVLGDGNHWTVFGEAQAHVVRNGTEAAYAAGDSFDLGLTAIA